MAIFIEPLFDHAFSIDFEKLNKIMCRSPGYNQSEQPSMLEAKNDSEAIRTFLSDYQHVKLTYRSYLKEIERLLLWCIYVPKITISDLKREHLIAYRQFILNPEPISVWCGAKKPKLNKDGSYNKDWRPFVAGLSPPTARKTTSILDSFFNYLVQNNYLGGNPLAVDKRRKGKKSNSTDRWLEREEINCALYALNEHSELNADRVYEAARAKYIILTLFYTGLRLAELAGHTMGDFCLMEGEWFLNVIGKGEKPRKIAVVDEYLDVLVTFRKLCGFKSSLPDFGEKTPLIPAVDKKSSITDNRIGQILRWAFDLGAQRLEASSSSLGSEKEFIAMHKATKLRKASAHWLRHSYGTYLVKSGCPIEKVRELMGHSDISTTMIYVHIAQRDLHASVRHLSIRDDPEPKED